MPTPKCAASPRRRRQRCAHRRARARLKIALADKEPRVRLEALRAWGRQLQKTSCAPIRAALTDANPTSSCRRSISSATPVPAARTPPTQLARHRAIDSTPAPRTWHAPAHALVSLARQRPDTRAAALPRFVQHPTWQVRMYAARAAACWARSTTLNTLAADPNDNVREAALSSLIDLKRPEAVDGRDRLAARARLPADPHRRSRARRQDAGRAGDDVARCRRWPHHARSARTPRAIRAWRSSNRLQAYGDASQAGNLEGLPEAISIRRSRARPRRS